MAFTWKRDRGKQETDTTDCMQRERTSVKLLGCSSTKTESKQTTWDKICNKCEMVKSFWDLFVIKAEILSIVLAALNTL